MRKFIANSASLVSPWKATAGNRGLFRTHLPKANDRALRDSGLTSPLGQSTLAAPVSFKCVKDSVRAIGAGIFPALSSWGTRELRDDVPEYQKQTPRAAGLEKLERCPRNTSILPQPSLSAQQKSSKRMCGITAKTSHRTMVAGEHGCALRPVVRLTETLGVLAQTAAL